MYTYNYEAIGALAAGFFFIFAIAGLIALVIAIVTIIGMWKVLEKGNKPGWGALIPFYNLYLLCDMVGVNPWWILIVVLSPILGVIPVLGNITQLAVVVYFEILLNVSLARAFKKEDGFAVGLILLAPIFYLILGFGQENKYEEKKPMKDLLFDNIKENQQNNSNVKEAYYEETKKYCPACGTKIEIDTKYCPKCGKEL